MSLLRAFLILPLMALPVLAEDNPLPPRPRPVVTEILTSEAARLRSFPGLIAARVETALAFQTTGRVASRPADRGDRVKAGDVLATLDQITLGEDVAAARAAVAAAQAQADLAGQSLARAERLNQRGVAATSQLEAATAQRDSAAASLRAAEADLLRAEDAARFGTLRAPSDGVVIAVSAEPGAVVSPGTPVLTLAAKGGLEAVIDVPGDVLALLPPDAQFTLRPRMGEGQAVPGQLRLIEPVADSGARNHRLRVTLQGESPTLRIGSLVMATLDLPVDPVLTLPQSALIDGTASVWRITGPDRLATRVPVTLGAPLGDRVIVTQGLASGDEILVRGVHSVQDGQPLGERIE